VALAAAAASEYVAHWLCLPGGSHSRRCVTYCQPECLLTQMLCMPWAWRTCATAGPTACTWMNESS